MLEFVVKAADQVHEKPPAIPVDLNVTINQFHTGVDHAGPSLECLSIAEDNIPALCSSKSSQKAPTCVALVSHAEPCPSPVEPLGAAYLLSGVHPSQ